MRKRVLASCLAVLLVCGLVPAAGAAVSSGDAQAYLNVLDNNPRASSYLVDFDGDGSDELLLIEEKDKAHLNYEIWQGDARLGQRENLFYSTLSLAEKDGQVYLTEYTQIGGDEIIKCSTIVGGKWTLTDDLGSAWSEGIEQYSCTHNGVSISREQFVSLWKAFRKTVSLAVEGHSVRNELIAALDTPSDSYQDVLNTLSASEKKAIFESFLPPFFLYNADYRTISDQELLQMINDAWYDHDIPFDAIDRLSWIKLPNFDSAITKSDADKLTTSLFGRTLDFSKFNRSTLPDPEDMDNFCYVYQNMLCFHAYFGMGGFPGTIQYIPQHLYDLGNGYFAASMINEWRNSDGTLDSSYLAYSVIKENADGTYRFIRTYPANYVPTDAELAAFTKPSSWAQAEISAAQAAGLIPELVNDPCWQSKATRLHFAQLAVRLAEIATGETLPAAPASTFADCTDLAVRKAYAAGIVNGTTATTFSPQNKLTREQLATMLWRAVDYIQTRTGESTLTAGGSLTGYTDAGQVSAYAREAVAALAHHSIMQGTGPTTLSPKNDCTVEQSVVLAYRTLEKLG